MVNLLGAYLLVFSAAGDCSVRQTLRSSTEAWEEPTLPQWKITLPVRSALSFIKLLKHKFVRFKPARSVWRRFLLEAEAVPTTKNEIMAIPEKHKKSSAPQQRRSLLSKG